MVRRAPSSRSTGWRSSTSRPAGRWRACSTSLPAFAAAIWWSSGALELTPTDLDRVGRHPEFGPVSLRQLLATWTAHDLDHVMQITRVLGRQYSDEVGPWRAYLRVISGTQG